MPHCILEYSANVVDRPDVTRLLKEIHDALMATGLFTLTDIKWRKHASTRPAHDRASAD